MMLVQLHQNIYIRRHTKYVTAEQLVKDLRAKNVTLVLNVTPVIDSGFAKEAWTAGITYEQVPMLDNFHVPVDIVEQLVRRVVEEVTHSSGVMIHCNQGCNRSALIAILAIIQLTGCQPIDAIHQAKAIRPAVLRNKSFDRYVREHGLPTTSCR